jgi:predicted RND superfamily exporter protein
MLLLVVNFLIESRRPFLGVITILPVALVVLWVFGAMRLTGISFNPVTAMIAAIAIGIGVPYTIHITHRYQEDRLRSDSPEAAIRSTMTHTGGALAGSAFTTVAGFGILITSTLKPFQQFGLVVGYAIGFALVAAVLVLPSMLVLWDRWHRRRGEAVIDEARFTEAIALENGG